jgi:tetratricopeptide (TPR) repeat protein
MGVASAGSTVWATVAYLAGYQFSLVAALIGAAVGTVMARLRPGGRSLAFVSALRAVVGFSRAIDRYAGDRSIVWDLIRRGLTYQAMGRREEALADFTRAIELDPGFRDELARYLPSA